MEQIPAAPHLTYPQAQENAQTGLALLMVQPFLHLGAKRQWKKEQLCPPFLLLHPLLLLPPSPPPPFASLPPILVFLLLFSLCFWINKDDRRKNLSIIEKITEVWEGKHKTKGRHQEKVKELVIKTIKHCNMCTLLQSLHLLCSHVSPIAHAFIWLSFLIKCQRSSLTIQSKIWNSRHTPHTPPFCNPWLCFILTPIISWHYICLSTFCLHPLECKCHESRELVFFTLAVTPGIMPDI